MTPHGSYGMIGVLVVCSACAVGEIRFTNVTQSSGIDLVMVSGQDPSREILEVNGGGVALFDFDNDGDLDLFFANGATMSEPEQGPGSRLYANNGDGEFVDVTQRFGIALKRWAMGVAVGDYDGDGYDDLYVTSYGRNVLLRNDCGRRSKRFTDVTAEAGVGDTRWSTSAAFGDIDGDGDLDLYVANYLVFDVHHPPSRAGKLYKGVNVMAGPHGLTPQADVLYENAGDGTFRDISVASGCASVSPGYGLVAAMVDYDADGRQDVFVGNDSAENFLFRNLSNRKFESVGVVSGVASNMDGTTQATMGIAIGDVDGNGFPDLFTSNFSSDTNTLHLNLDGAFFDDRTSQYGLGLVSRRFLSWGCGFYDFDSDGDEDLFVSNGHVYPEAMTHDIDSDYEQQPLLFERGAGARFRRVTAAGDIFSKPLRGRATAFGDIDNDGDVDVILTTLNGPVRVLRNDSPPADVLVVDLQLEPPNHRGHGAIVELIGAGGTQRRWIRGGGSFQSSDAPVAYFGLGSEKASKLKLRVRFPDGRAREIDGLLPNRRVTVTSSGYRTSALRNRRP